MAFHVPSNHEMEKRLADPACVQDQISGIEKKLAAASIVGHTIPEAYLLKLSRNYVIEGRLGEGPLGTVWRAYVKERRRKATLKYVSKVLDYHVALHALREIRYMLLLRHQNIIALENVIGEKNVELLRYIIIQMELMDCSLSTCLYGNYQILREIRGIETCIFQLLSGLHYIHSAQVIHRNLSMHNVFVDLRKSIFKIGDFDWATKLGAVGTNGLTGERKVPSCGAPEVIFTPQTYSYSLDMWSLGCILYELFNRRLFLFCGNFTPFEYMQEIITTIGRVEEDEIAFIGEAEMASTLLKMNGARKIPWADISPITPKAGLDLMEGLLKFNPHERLTAEKALEMDFVTNVKPADYLPAKYNGVEAAAYNYGTEITEIINQLKLNITVDLSESPPDSARSSNQPLNIQRSHSKTKNDHLPDEIVSACKRMKIV